MSGSPDTAHGRRWFRRLAWLALALALPASALLVWREKAAKPPLPTLGRVPSFSLLERDGSTVRREDLTGRPWVADFIFTRCVLSCPRLTAEMKRLRERLPDREAVRLVSLSVDPEHDRPEVLAEYAARHGIAPDDRGWLFLTGEHDPVWALIREGFRVAVSRPEPGPLANPLEPIVHSTHFVLVDATGEIRGYYSAFDEEAVNRLLADLARLLAAAPSR